MLIYSTLNVMSQSTLQLCLAPLTAIFDKCTGSFESGRTCRMQNELTEELTFLSMDSEVKENQRKFNCRPSWRLNRSQISGLAVRETADCANLTHCVTEHNQSAYNTVQTTNYRCI